MKKLKGFTKGFKNLELLDENNRRIASVQYPKWYSYEAEISALSGNSRITTEGFWNNRLIQTDSSGKKLRTAVHNWSGFSIEEATGEKYMLEVKGFLSYNYLLKNENKETVLEIQPKFRWKYFNHEYDILISGNFQPPESLVILALHCVYYIMQSAAASG